MKKFICLLIVIICAISISSCKNNNKFNKTDSFKQLSKVSYPSDEYDNNLLDQSLVNKVNESYFKLAENLIVENQNFIFSPISLYMALAMLTEGATTESYSELTNYLGVNDLEELRVLNNKLFKNNYYKNKNGAAKIANSFWIDYKLNVKEEIVKTLQTNYYSEVFNLSFKNSKDRENIVKWINQKTNNFLNLDEKNYKISEDLVFALINTIYFNNQWLNKFEKSNTYKDKFYGENVNNVDYMVHTISTSYKETNNYIVVKDYFKNNNSICYLLPNEGENIYNYVHEDVTKFSDYENVTATINVPKFKYLSSNNLNEPLKKVGINKIFDKNGGKLENINDSVFISMIKQDVGIEFSEEGVKAAASTMGSGAPTSGPIEKFVSVKLERPFIYYILDANNTILFVGIVNNI